MSNIIYFNRVNLKKGKSGTVYVGDYNVSINDEQIKIKLKIIESPTENKSNTRIDKLTFLNEGKHRLTDSFFQRSILPVITRVINICDNQFNLLLMQNEDHPENFEVNLSNKQIVIPNDYELSSSEIKAIIKNSNKKLDFFDITFINFLDDFINEWNKKISENTSETGFRNFLLNNARLFPSIFGIEDINNIFDNEFKKEDKLIEVKENRTDISNDSFIIELKTPKTKIFNKSNERNNISGLSKELISGLNQLSLYCLKKDREKNLENLNFTKGVLIIGSNNEFLDENNNKVKEKILSWNLFRQNYKFEILTFDDISKRVKNLKENIIDLQKNNKQNKKNIFFDNINEEIIYEI